MKALTQDHRYTEMVAVADWAPAALMPTPARALFQAFLIERAAYFAREVVWRAGDGGGKYVFATDDLEHAWNAITGHAGAELTEVEMAGRAILSMIVYGRLSRGAEWLTIDQFFEAAGMTEEEARRAELNAKVRELYASEDHPVGAPPYHVEFDPRTGTVRRAPTLPRCLLVALLHGSLEDALPSYGSDDQ